MTNRHVVERYVEALKNYDLDAQVALLHDDYEGRYPQSGEVIRGIANRRSVGEEYPGARETGLRATPTKIIGQDDQFVTGPMWNMVHLSGSGDEFTIAGTIDYPNGERWHAVALLTLRGGKIWREIDYFAAPFERPAWRAPFTELEPGQP